MNFFHFPQPPSPHHFANGPSLKLIGRSLRHTCSASISDVFAISLVISEGKIKYEGTVFKFLILQFNSRRDIDKIETNLKDKNFIVNLFGYFFLSLLYFKFKFQVQKLC